MTYRLFFSVWSILLTLALSGCDQPKPVRPPAKQEYSKTKISDAKVPSKDDGMYPGGSDWCGGHGLPESKCTKCNPSLVDKFKAAGDWCQEHGFPESACPVCNPVASTGGESEEVADWCVEHSISESKCTKCNPSLVDKFKAAGDWCQEHGFPESACPVCNPQRVPIGVVFGDVIKLDEESLKLNGIRTQRVRASTSSVSTKVPAEVQLDQNNVAHVSTLVPSQLKTVAVTQGDRVEQGQVLAELKSVELGLARAAVRRARVIQKAAKQNLDRQRALRQEGINSARALLEAELRYDTAQAEYDAARSRLDVFGGAAGRGPEMSLKSPIQGVVVTRHATRGEHVSAQDTLFIIADLRRVWVIGRVYEQDMGRVSQGMSVTLSLNAYPGRTWEGKIDYMGDTLDESTRSMPVRVELANPEGVLRPGLFGDLVLEGAISSGDAVSVPADAIQRVNGQPVVFVPSTGPGTFQARAVEIDHYSGEEARIVKGLEVGESIVVQGAFTLKSHIMRHALGEGCAH